MVLCLHSMASARWIITDNTHECRITHARKCDSLIQKSKSQIVMVHSTERIQTRFRILHPGTVAISSMVPRWSAKKIVSNKIPMGKTICAIFKIKKATTKPRTVRIAANNNAAANVVQRMSVIENFIFADSIKSILITAV